MQLLKKTQQTVTVHGVKVSNYRYPTNCMRLQGGADARRRARRRTCVLQVPGNAADGVPCERIQQTGHIIDPEGRSIPFEDQLDVNSYMALYEVLRLTRPEKALELGFAHGCATLYMLQALADNQKGQLISVDPMQQIQYRSGGLQHVRQAGFAHLHHFLEAPSQLVLPRLLLNHQAAAFER